MSVEAIDPSGLHEAIAHPQSGYNAGTGAIANVIFGSTSTRDLR